jgi:hypothetical protein
LLTGENRRDIKRVPLKEEGGTTVMKKRQAVLLMAVLVTALSMASGAAFAGDQTTGKLLNIVQCPNQPDNETCIGTESGDHLVGGDEFDKPTTS